jgi:hypothetical protein
MQFYGRQPTLEYRTWDGLEDGHGRLSSSPARRITIPWQAFCLSLTPWTFFFALVDTEWVHFCTLREMVILFLEGVA